MHVVAFGCLQLWESCGLGEENVTSVATSVFDVNQMASFGLESKSENYLGTSFPEGGESLALSPP